MVFVEAAGQEGYEIDEADIDEFDIGGEGIEEIEQTVGEIAEIG
jgi:hypothetical protein